MLLSFFHFFQLISNNKISIKYFVPCIDLIFLCFSISRLAVPGKEIHEDGALDPKFITDCVEKSELISMNKYK